jgi:hypothetical protein
MQSPDLAVAKAIDGLTAKGLTLEMLSNLSENDVPRLSVMLTVGQDPDMDAGFLTQLAYNELALMCSVVMKRGGIRSEQIVEVAKTPPMMMDSNVGLIDKIRGRLRR